MNAIDDLDLNAAALFTKVVEKGSFTAAAAALGLRVSTVSRRVARFEAQVGSRLLHRTTRKLSLTDAGRTFHGTLVSGLEQIEVAAATLENLQSEPSGRIRFTCLSGMGSFAWGLIGGFMAQHPKVSIEMELTERTVDLVGEGYDLALRTGNLPDSSLISRHLADSRFALFAHPEYLERHGQLSTPDDLQQHECLIFGVASHGAKWELSSQRSRLEVAVAGRLATTSLETIFNACAEGFGIGQLPVRRCQALVAEGRLVRVLPAWAGDVHGLFLVYPSRTVAPSVRAFIDYLVKQVDDALLRVE